MDYLTLQDIIDHAMPTGDVEVPEWGGKVEVRAITNAELARCQKQSTNTRNGELDGIELNARIAEVGCMQPRFAPGQYKVLMEKEPGPVQRIVERILDLSGTGESEAEQGEA